jgi:hypothetical protein
MLLTFASNVSMSVSLLVSAWWTWGTTLAIHGKTLLLARSLKALLIPLLLVETGCVGPARSFTTYESKAAQAADTILSSVESARLAAELSASLRAPGPYVAVLASNAEEDADSARASFDSIQPPDRSSDELRARADATFARAISTISLMRIAARREDLSTLRRLRSSLQRIIGPLDRIVNLQR